MSGIQMAGEADAVTFLGNLDNMEAAAEAPVVEDEQDTAIPDEGADDREQTQQTEDEQPEGDDESPEDSESEDDGEPEEDAEGDDAPAITDDTEIDLGNGTKATIAELKRGNLREADYTRKTQELAAERSAFEQSKAQQVAEATQHWLAQAEAMQRALQGDNAVDHYLAEAKKAQDEGDALTAMQYRELARDERDKQTALNNQIAQVRAGQKADAEAQYQQHLATNAQALREKLPDAFDEKKGPGIRALAEKALLSAGYKPEETNIADHRAFILAYKAGLYDEMVAKGKKPSPELKAKPPVSLPKGRAATGPITKEKAAFQRFKSNPSRENAQSFLANL